MYLHCLILNNGARKTQDYCKNVIFMSRESLECVWEELCGAQSGIKCTCFKKRGLLSNGLRKQDWDSVITVVFAF